MPDSILTPVASSKSSSGFASTPIYQAEYDMMSEASSSSSHIRPVLHLTGTRNYETNEVSVFCRCTDFPVYSHPIIALFVCRDSQLERDRFIYLGQTQPTPIHREVETELGCLFKIADCPPPTIVEKEESNECLTPRSLADRISRGIDPTQIEKPSAPVTQLKLNVYATNTSNTELGDGTLQSQDILGTAYVDIERLLEHKEGEEPRGVSVALMRPSYQQLAYSSKSSSVASSSATPPYTTLHISHQIPSSSLVSPIITSPASLGLYGVREESVETILTTPAMQETRLHEDHEAFVKRQKKEEAARLEREKRKPITDARQSRYELEKSRSPTLGEHKESNSRMCSSADGCIIC